MKLLTKYSRINLLSSVIIFVLASIAFYILLRLVLVSQVDEDLKIEQHEIEMYVQRFNRVPEAMPVKDQKIYYQPVTEHTGKSVFSNIDARDPGEHKRHVSRRLTFFIAAQDQWFQVFVEKSLEETEVTSRSIIIISLATIIAMLAAGFIINRLLLRKLWKPFYTSLALMKDFRLEQSRHISLKNTNIDEFNDLNKTLQQSMESAGNEYRQLKEFTENASHELQTPLAVLRSKMDVLAQDEQLSESQSQLIQSAYEAIRKLARLNQSMLLLSKIGNRQFADTTPINIRLLVEEKMSYFKELTGVKNITITSNLEQVVVTMNEALAEILLNNLFGNAIKYTPPGGSINVALRPSSLLFSNTAAGAALDASKIFNRFYKGEQTGETHGLGLSIVKQICLVSGFSIGYFFNTGRHHFEVYFNPVQQAAG
jgi:two-component system, OmpR family, sensor histidine kinase QseC